MQTGRKGDTRRLFRWTKRHGTDTTHAVAHTHTRTYKALCRDDQCCTEPENEEIGVLMKAAAPAEQAAAEADQISVHVIPESGEFSAPLAGAGSLY